MFITSLKNFFKNLKYFIVPIGVIALFFLFGISISIPAMVRSIQKMIASIKETTSSTTLDFGSFLSSLTGEILNLNWTSASEVISTITSKDWLLNTFKQALISLVGEEAIASVTDAIFTCIIGIVVAIVFVVLMLGVGMIVGYIVVKSVIKHSMIKGKFLETILYGLLKLLMIIVLVALAVFLFIVWPPSIFIFVFVIIVALHCWSIFLAWLQFGRKHISFGELFSFKNTALSILADSVIIIITFVINWLLSFIISNVFLFFVSISIVEIMMATNSFNIRNYVQGLVNKKAEEQQPVEEAK